MERRRDRGYGNQTEQPSPEPHNPAQRAQATSHAPLNGPGFASVLLGVVGVLLANGRGAGWVLGAAALGFGVVGLRRTPGRGLAVAGLVLGTAAVVIATLRVLL